MIGKKYKGNKACYRAERRLGSGKFGQAWEGKVISVKGKKKWLTEAGPRRGDIVVIKWANLGDQYSVDEDRAFLKKVNSTIRSELSSLKRLAELKCVAHVYDYGRTYVKPNGRSRQEAIFLVEEFLDGTRFDKYLGERFGQGTGKKTFRGISDSSKFMEHAIRLATVVRDIHHQGVIHGDIWQKNIMVRKMESKPDELCFFDLGASVIRDTALLRPDRLARRRSDGYCAPERRLGERHGRRSDIYTLWEGFSTSWLLASLLLTP